MSDEDVNRAFQDDDLTPEQTAKYKELLSKGRELAYMIIDFVPGPEERKDALKSIKLGIMMAKAGIARN